MAATIKKMNADMKGKPGCTIIIAKYEMDLVCSEIEKTMSKLQLTEEGANGMGTIFEKINRQLTCINDLSVYMS